MARLLLRRATTLYARGLLSHPPLPKPHIPILSHLQRSHFSSDSSPPPPPTSVADPKPDAPLVEDVSNKDLKGLIEQYFKGDEDVLHSIAEAILRRRMLRKHEETDDELYEEMRMHPLADVNDHEFDSDFDNLETDEEIDNLYNTTEYVKCKMGSDPFFNMSDRKWDDMIREATEKGFLKDTKECDEILEDMQPVSRSLLLRECWHKNPEYRPSFEDIIIQLELVQEKLQKKRFFEGGCNCCVL